MQLVASGWVELHGHPLDQSWPEILSLNWVTATLIDVFCEVGGRRGMVRHSGRTCRDNFQLDMRHWCFLLMLPKVREQPLRVLGSQHEACVWGGYKSPEMLLRELVRVDGLAHTQQYLFSACGL